jgi:hypothetical protein
MTPISPNQVKLTVDFAQQIVNRLAPDEKEIFFLYSSQFEQNPDIFDDVLKGKNFKEALGFDLQTGVEIVLTALILPIVKDIIVELYNKLRREKKKDIEVVITEADFNYIRQRVREHARKTILSDEQVEQLINVFIEIIKQKGLNLDSGK